MNLSGQSIKQMKSYRPVIPILLLISLSSAQEVVKQTSSSADVDAVIAQLKALDKIPVEGWRSHVGDVAHGEKVDLNDGSWEIVKENRPAPVDSVWYRKRIEVPASIDGYDLTGARIWFSFRASANGPVPEIIFFDGRRVAMGDNLEPIVLFDSAKPGDHVVVAVKLLSTIDQKRFSGAVLRVEFSSSRPNVRDLLQEIQSAWNLAPSLGAQASVVREGVERAARAVDLRALHDANQKAFDASLEKSHSLLAELKPDLQASSVRLAGNAHIDAEWLWPWTETVDVVHRTFGTALQLMNEYPQYTYTQSAAAYNEWMFQKYPSLHQQIVDRVKEGRWEMVGGMWIEPDLNMPDGESLVRQLLVGKRYIKEKFGTEIRIGWNPDSFGYNWQLPQIYKKSGIDYFVTQKIAWNGTNPLPLKVFWWQSPDGSRVLAYFPHHCCPVKDRTKSVG